MRAGHIAITTGSKTKKYWLPNMAATVRKWAAALIILIRSRLFRVTGPQMILSFTRELTFLKAIRVVHLLHFTAAGIALRFHRQDIMLHSFLLKTVTFHLTMRFLQMGLRAPKRL